MGEQNREGKQAKIGALMSRLLLWESRTYIRLAPELSKMSKVGLCNNIFCHWQRVSYSFKSIYLWNSDLLCMQQILLMAVGKGLRKRRYHLPRSSELKCWGTISQTPIAPTIVHSSILVLCIKFLFPPVDFSRSLSVKTSKSKGFTYYAS